MNDTFRGLTFRSKIPSINPEILLKTVNLTPESNFKRRKALKKQCFAPFFRQCGQLLCLFFTSKERYSLNIDIGCSNPNSSHYCGFDRNPEH